MTVYPGVISASVMKITPDASPILRATEADSGTVQAAGLQKIFTILRDLAVENTTWRLGPVIAALEDGRPHILIDLLIDPS